MFLEKYGFTVILLTEDSLDKTYEEVKTLIQDGKIKFIYGFKEDKIGDKLDSFIKNNSLEHNYLYRIDSISDEQRKNNEDYISIMKDNLELIKLEIYG